jgi:hypothetical protein
MSKERCGCGCGRKLGKPGALDIWPTHGGGIIMNAKCFKKKKEEEDQAEYAFQQRVADGASKDTWGR